jgi:hypothetical protein
MCVRTDEILLSLARPTRRYSIINNVAAYHGGDPGEEGIVPSANFSASITRPWKNGVGKNPQMWEIPHPAASTLTRKTRGIGTALSTSTSGNSLAAAKAVFSGACPRRSLKTYCGITLHSPDDATVFSSLIVPTAPT